MGCIVSKLFLDFYIFFIFTRPLSRQRKCFPINAPGMGRFQMLNLGVLGYGLELRFWVVIAILVSLTLTITLITTLTIIFP